MNITPLHTYLPIEEGQLLMIAGPCSAESEEQILSTAQKIRSIEAIQVFRSGIWKPRTRPGHFEGIGKEGLAWLDQVKKENGFLTAVEVATPKHIESVLQHSVDMVWLGARTVSNPFSIEEIAQALKGVDLAVWVKNPINPDIELWTGALERLNRNGINKLGAIHRGFYPFEKTELRNIPKWEIPIELKRRFPDLPIICDPSHISGQRQYIQDISQKALDMNFDGLMIESHCQPEQALSDAQQQLTPEDLSKLMQSLKIRQRIGSPKDQFIEQSRHQIDSIDTQLLELLSQRMEIIKSIGRYKATNNLSVFQLERWESILKTRLQTGEKLQLSPDFIRSLLQKIHKESILAQNEIMNS